MATPNPSGNKEKLASKLPELLRVELKIRAAEHRIDIQDAVSEGVKLWQATGEKLDLVDTTGATPFSSWLPAGQWDGLRATCKKRGIPFVQGLAQAVKLWLREHPSPKHHPVTGVPRRIVV
ncbi:ParA family protein, partial [Streptomyces sp. NPDC057910]